MVGIFWLTMFTNAGKICSGSYMKIDELKNQKDNGIDLDYYQIMESRFIKFVTILQISLYLVVIIALSQYK